MDSIQSSTKFFLQTDGWLSAAQERGSLCIHNSKNFKVKSPLLMETSLATGDPQCIRERDRADQFVGFNAGESWMNMKPLRPLWNVTSPHKLNSWKGTVPASRKEYPKITASHSSALSALWKGSFLSYLDVSKPSEELSQRKELNLRLKDPCLSSRKDFGFGVSFTTSCGWLCNDESNVKHLSWESVPLRLSWRINKFPLQNSTSRVTELEEQLKEMGDIKLQLESGTGNSSKQGNELQESKVEIEHLKGDKERLEEELKHWRINWKLTKNRLRPLNKEIEELKSQIEAQSRSISNLKLKTTTNPSVGWK